MNSIDSPVIAYDPDPSTLIVDSTRLSQGERVVINNDVYTIQYVENYDHLIRDYDFTISGSSLADWETDVTRSAFSGDFRISASPVSASSYALIQHTTTSYRHLFIKDIMRPEVKVEAWISNYRNITSGTSDRGALGITMHADPAMDFDRSYDSAARTLFEVDADNGRYRLLQRYMGNDSNHRLASASIALDGLKKYTLETRNGMIKGYIDDQQVAESYARSGYMSGRVGLYCNNQNAFTCTRYKVYIPGQRIILDRPVSCSIGDIVYETGAEYTHKSGNIVVKQASMIEDELGHANLSYCYRGATDYDGSGIFPYIYNVTSPGTSSVRNGNVNNAQVLSGATTFDLAFLSLATSTGSIIIDLTTPQTVTHLSYREYYRVIGQHLTGSQQVRIQSSNDLITWTECFGPAIDPTRRETSDSLRFYEFSAPQTARWFRFIKTGGVQGTTTSQNENIVTSLGLHDYSGGYAVKLNNVSDFEVGDRIMLTYNAGYGIYIQEADYYSNLITGALPSGSWTDRLTDYYTVTAVDAINKTITLDRPYTHGYLQRGMHSRVMKLNKSVEFSGERGTGIWKPGRFNILQGGPTLGRKYVFRNMSIRNTNGQYPTSIAFDYQISNFGTRNVAAWEADIFDGISFYDSLAQATSYNAYFSFSGGSFLVRDSVFSKWNGRGWLGYYTNITHPAYYVVGNMFAYSIMAENAFFNSTYGDLTYNYNCVYGNSNTSCNLPRFPADQNTGAWLSPTNIYIRRNYSNGGVAHGTFFISNPASATGRSYRYYIDSNMHEYADDSISLVYQHMYEPQMSMILQKRPNTDNRISRFNNIGLISTSRLQFPTVAYSFIKNINNWGYDISRNIGGTFIKYPTETFVRAYRDTNVYQDTMFGTTFLIDDNETTVNLTLGFEYFHSKDQAYLMENTNNAALTLYVFRDGKQIQSQVVLPKPMTMTPYSASFTFSGSGMYAVGYGQAARNGYVAFQNMYSRFTSTNPAKFNILTNTFDLRQTTIAYPREYDQFDAYTRKDNTSTIRLSGIRL
jgi:hypothetical protein